MATFQAQVTGLTNLVINDSSGTPSTTELTTFLDGKVAQDTLPIGQDYNFDWEHNNSNLYIQLSINESAFRESKHEDFM